MTRSAYRRARQLARRIASGRTIAAVSYVVRDTDGRTWATSWDFARAAGCAARIPGSTITPHAHLVEVGA